MLFKMCVSSLICIPSGTVLLCLALDGIRVGMPAKNLVHDPCFAVPYKVSEIHLAAGKPARSLSFLRL